MRAAARCSSGSPGTAGRGRTSAPAGMWPELEHEPAVAAPLADRRRLDRVDRDALEPPGVEDERRVASARGCAVIVEARLEEQAAAHRVGRVDLERRRGRPAVVGRRPLAEDVRARARTRTTARARGARAAIHGCRRRPSRSRCRLSVSVSGALATANDSTQRAKYLRSRASRRSHSPPTRAIHATASSNGSGVTR